MLLPEASWGGLPYGLAICLQFTIPQVHQKTCWSSYQCRFFYLTLLGLVGQPEKPFLLFRPVYMVHITVNPFLFIELQGCVWLFLPFAAPGPVITMKTNAISQQSPSVDIQKIPFLSTTYMKDNAPLTVLVGSYDWVTTSINSFGILRCDNCNYQCISDKSVKHQKEDTTVVLFLYDTINSVNYIIIFQIINLLWDLPQILKIPSYKPYSFYLPIGRSILGYLCLPPSV